jgi:hypothetical protein
VRERSGEDFDAGGEKGAELIEAGLVGAEALADEESAVVEPDEVAGFGGGGGLDFGEGGNVFGAGGGVRVGFGNAGGLAGTHEDEAVGGGEGGVVGVDGVEGEGMVFGEGEDIGSGKSEEMAESLVLGLGDGEVGWVMEAEVWPGGGALGIVPSGMGGRTNEDLAEWGGHGLDGDGRLGG